MLKRKYRLKDRRDFKAIYRHGKSVRMGDLAIFALPNQLGHNRLSVIVSTKVSKRAVRRNRIRRRLSGAMEFLWPKLNTSYDLLISVKTDISQSPAADINQQLNQSLKRLGLL